MREESGRNSANMVDASRNAGIRGIMGAIPKIQANDNAVNRQIQVDLDNQVMKKEYAVAGDKVGLRDMRENRDNANIAAFSSQLQKGDADMMNGISGVAKGIQYGANNIDFGITDKNGNSGSYAERQAKRIAQSSGSGGSNTVVNYGSVPSYGNAVYPSPNPYRFGPMAPAPIALNSNNLDLEDEYGSDLINKYNRW